MAHENEAILNLPSEDEARQAVGAIRGYAYQLYASALTWLRLASEDKLLIEVAEDYAVVAKDAIELAQVRDTSGSGAVTLRTEGVVKCLNAFWRLRAINPGRRVSLVYLTTSTAGVEKGAFFVDGAGGISNWRRAARENAPLAELRKLLLALPLEEQFTRWVAASDDDVLRADLVQAVRFECGAPPLGELDALLEGALIGLGEQLSIPPDDARRSKPAILTALMRLASTVGQRTLDRPTLLKLFEAASSVTLPASVHRALLTRAATAHSGASFGAGDVIPTAAAIPRDPTAIKRSATLDEMRLALGASRDVWLYGASGVGKTLVALDFARASNRSWRIVELRNLQPEAIVERLRLARIYAASSEFGGVILDDFPEAALHAAQLELSRLREAITIADGALIFTAYKPPPPSFHSLFSADGLFELSTPHFSEEEVAALISANGGDPELWTKVTHVFCGSGHPQLVAARVSGLRRRNWPKEERAAGFPTNPAQDIELERETIRARLIAELPEHARAMLYRLTLIGAFDRDMAVEIGAAAPAIARPGEALDILVGPWLEQTSDRRMRASPLVADAGAKVLAQGEVRSVHEAVCKSLRARNPFPADLLSQLLMSALLVGDERALGLIAAAPLRTRGDLQLAIAGELFPMRYFRTDRPIFEGNRHLSAMLRLTQLRILLASDDRDELRSTYLALLAETEELEGGTDIRNAAAISLLPHKNLRWRAGEWFAVVRSLEDFQTTPPPEDEVPEGVDPKAQPADVMFIWRATQLKDTEELLELCAVLDALPRPTREHYLTLLRDPYYGRRAMIQTAWLNETGRSDFDARAAITRLQQLEGFARNWGDVTLECEAICSCAILQAEYLDDPDAALAVLDNAAQRWPTSPRVGRERAKVQFRLGRHADVVETIGGILDNIPSSDPLERVHALREIAVSTAQTGDLQRSLQFTEDAIAAAGDVVVLADLRVGLIADKAILLFEGGDPTAAVRALHAAALAFDELKPNGPRWEFLVRVLAGLGSWILTKLTSPDEYNIMVFGFGSRNPPEDEWPTPVPPLQAVWYQLATLERHVGVDLGIKEILAKKTAGAYIEAFEVSFALDRMRAQIDTDDVDAFVAALDDYSCLGQYIESGDARNGIESVTTLLARLPWTDLRPGIPTVAVRNFVLNAIIGYISLRMLRGAPSQRDEIQTALRSNESFAPLADMLDGFDAVLTREDNFPIMLMSSVSAISAERSPAADDLLVASFRIWDWLKVAELGKVLTRPFAARISMHWAYVATHATFSLRTPTKTAPPIVAASCASDVSGIARLILAAHEALPGVLTTQPLQRLRADV